MSAHIPEEIFGIVSEYCDSYTKRSLRLLRRGVDNYVNNKIVYHRVPYYKKEILMTNEQLSVVEHFTWSKMLDYSAAENELVFSDKLKSICIHGSNNKINLTDSINLECMRIIYGRNNVIISDISAYKHLRHIEVDGNNIPGQLEGIRTLKGLKNLILRNTSMSLNYLSGLVIDKLILVKNSISINVAQTINDLQVKELVVEKTGNLLFYSCNIEKFYLQSSIISFNGRISELYIDNHSYHNLTLVFSTFVDKLILEEVKYKFNFPCKNVWGTISMEETVEITPDTFKYFEDARKAGIRSIIDKLMTYEKKYGPLE